MRLLVVSQYFWPESFRINEVVESLSKRGIHVEVLTGKPNYPDGNIFLGHTAAGCISEPWRDATLHRVPIFPRGRKSSLRLALNYISFLISATLWGPWLLRGVKFDAIFVYATSPLLQALPALALARSKGCPLVLWIQDLWPDSLEATGYVRTQWILAAVDKVVQFIYRRSDLILVSSRSFVPSVQRYAPRRTPIYYPNSVDNAFCDPESGPQPVVPALEDGFTVVFAGNLGTAQSVATIVDAARHLTNHSNIRFIILGTGSQQEWMKDEIARLGLKNIYLVGRFVVESMPFLLSRADVLLVTLANRPIFAATVPNKIQAYLAVGRPILACLNGEGAKLVTEAQAGIAVPAEDASALAEAVLNLYRMPAGEREAMGRNGREYFREHFDHDSLVQTLIEYLNMVTGREGKE